MRTAIKSSPSPMQLTCAGCMQVVGASFGPLLRFGTGALASGYKAEFVADDASSSGTYTLATMGGRRLKETSKVRAHAWVVYDCEGRPRLLLLPHCNPAGCWTALSHAFRWPRCCCSCGIVPASVHALREVTKVGTTAHGAAALQVPACQLECAPCIAQRSAPGWWPHCALCTACAGCMVWGLCLWLCWRSLLK